MQIVGDIAEYMNNAGYYKENDGKLMVIIFARMARTIFKRL